MQRFEPLDASDGGQVPGRAKYWQVSLLRPDGVQIDISEWNAPSEKDAPTTRTDPPFTIAELTSIARSSAWQARVSRETAQRAARLFVPDPPLDQPSGAKTTAPHGTKKS